MKRKYNVCLILFTLLLVLAFPVLTFAEPNEFQYQSPLQTSGLTQSPYGLLELSDEVLGQTRVGSPDLRLYRENEEVPFAFIPNVTRVENRIPAEMYNQGINASGDQIFEVKGPEGKWLTGFILQTSDKNFIRKVTVEGSSDQKNWRVIQSDRTLFDLSQENKSRNTEVAFPKTNLPYLRFTILNEGKPPLSWQGIQLILLEGKESVTDLRERPLTERSWTQNGVQEVILELKYPNLPVSELEIRTDDRNYSRRVEVFESAAGSDWKQLAQGEIFDCQLDQSTASNHLLTLRGSSKFYQVKIYNQDNQPLNLREIKLRGQNPSIVFPQTQNIAYTLRWGNSMLPSPQYDLVKLLPNLDLTKLNPYTLQPGSVNSNYKEQDTRPWTERNTWLLNSALVLVTLLLLSMILKSVKKFNKNP